MKSELKMEFNSRRALKESTSGAALVAVALASSGGKKKRSENRSG